MLTDLRRAARKLVRSPAFTFVAVLTLALGLGANTALFSVVRSTLLTPLPFAAPQKLVSLRCVYPDAPNQLHSAEGEFDHWQQQHALFASTAAYARRGQTLVLPDAPPRAIGGFVVTPNYLATLGLQPALGRDFLPADAAPGAAPVVLLTHALWQGQFAGHPGVVGATVRLGGVPTTVIGVLPAWYRGTLPNERAPEFLQPLELAPPEKREFRHYLQVIARLHPGITARHAERRLRELAAPAGTVQATHGVALEPLSDRASAGLHGRLAALATALGLMLLIACVNIANLMLVRLSGRSGEIAVKVALGAGCGRIAREILLEGLLIGGSAVALGCALAAGTLTWADSLLRAQFATFAPIRLDGATLAFSAALAFGTVLAFGLLPAWRATAAWERLVRALGRSVGASPGQRRLHRVFVCAQIALTMILLVGAGLLLRSLHRILTQENGFRTEHTLVAGLNLPVSRYDNRGVRRQFFERLSERLRAVPGIESAVVADSIPLSAGSYGPAQLRGAPWPADEAPTVDKASVGPGYFAALGMRLTEGREFSAADHADAPGAVVVNAAFARRFFPDRSPIGQEVSFDSGPNPDRWDRIVGVVSDVRLNALDREPAPAMFSCYLQSWVAFMYVIVRSPLDDAAVAQILRREIAVLDPELPLNRVAPLQSYLDSSLAQRQLLTWTLVATALLSLGLAVIGLYSVIAQTVAQQTREIGVRLALGADGAAIRRWILGGSVRLVAIGLGFGAAGSLFIVRLLQALVYGVAPWDPLTYAGVALLLGGLAVAASWWPARRAARVDPLVALRSE